MHVNASFLIVIYKPLTEKNSNDLAAAEIIISKNKQLQIKISSVFKRKPSGKKKKIKIIIIYKVYPSFPFKGIAAACVCACVCAYVCVCVLEAVSHLSQVCEPPFWYDRTSPQVVDVDVMGRRGHRGFQVIVVAEGSSGHSNRKFHPAHPRTLDGCRHKQQRQFFTL